MLCMAKATTKTTTKTRGRPRKPAGSPQPERTTFNLPPGTRDRILHAIALQTVLGDDAPRDATSFVIAAIDKLASEIEERARRRGMLQ